MERKRIHQTITVAGAIWLCVAWPLYLFAIMPRLVFIGSGLWLFDFLIAGLFAAEFLRDGLERR